MSYPTKHPEPTGWDWSVMEDARFAMIGVWERIYGGGSHAWWVRRYGRMSHECPTHPVVVRMYKNWRPLDWQQLLLEWPHVSRMDPTRLAYTPSQKYGEGDRQLVTSIGKYLNRHWPHVPDHLRRDAVASYTFDEIRIVRTTPEIIQGIEEGPRSCMQSGYGSIPFTTSDRARMIAWFKDRDSEEPRWGRHPYSVYSPALGWGMAVRVNGSEFLGRALVLETGNVKCFVRTYGRRSADEDQSSSDHVLEQWLQNQGYEFVGAWPQGARLLRLKHPDGGILAPYLDGNIQKVSIGDAHHLRIDEDGDLSCTDTFGQAEDVDDGDYSACERCGDRTSDGELTTVTRHEDLQVCEDCVTRYYTHVRGDTGPSSAWRNYREYYVQDDQAAELQCGSYSIDTEHPPEDVVQLEDGDWAEADDTVCIDGEYYLSEDEDICELANKWCDETHALKNDCWQCEGSKKWYHEDDTDDQVEVDGDYYHRDHLSTLVNATQRTLDLA